MLRAHLNRVCAAFVLLLMTAPAFAGVGKVMFVLGGASIERGQSAIAAQRGQQLESGDTLVTGLSGRMHVRMDDGAVISLKPDSRFELTDYAVEEAPAPAAQAPAPAEPDAPIVRTRSNGRAFMSLLKGGFRTITGLIGKADKEAYQIKTPVATIGIRGTHFEIQLINGELFLAVWDGAIDVLLPGGTTSFGDGQQFSFGLVNDEGEVTGFDEPPEAFGGTDDTSTLILGGRGESEGQGNGQGEDKDQTDQRRPVEVASTDDPEELDRDDDPDPDPEPDPVTPVATGAGPYRESSGFTTAALSRAVVIEESGDVTGFVAGHPDGAASYDVGTAAVTNTGFDPNTEIRWGRWADGVATIAIEGGATENLDLTSQSLHYIVGPTGDEPVLPITGTASYTLVGNTNPTDGNGNVGVLGSASLSANFTERTVDSVIDLAIADTVWNASGSGTLTDDSNLFSGTYDTVSVNGETAGNSGIFDGFFIGDGNNNGTPDGAGLIYNLTNGTDSVTGGAVFGEPSP